MLVDTGDNRNSYILLKRHVHASVNQEFLLDINGKNGISFPRLYPSFVCIYIQFNKIISSFAIRSVMTVTGKSIK